MAAISRDVKEAPEAVSASKSLVPIFPVRKKLATPTDLPSDVVEQLTNALNELVADAFALFLKTKNFHWHVAGAHFRDYHLLFDEQAEQLFASIDPLAERVRRIGGTTIRGVNHISHLQSIIDNDDAYVSPDEMLQELRDDNRLLAGRQRAAIELTEKLRDYPTGNLLQTLLDETEKRIWFLYEAGIDEETQP